MQKAMAMDFGITYLQALMAQLQVLGDAKHGLRHQRGVGLGTGDEMNPLSRCLEELQLY